APAPELRSAPSSAKIAFQRDSLPDEGDALAAAPLEKSEAEPSQTMRGTSAPGTLRAPPPRRRRLPHLLAGLAVLLVGVGIVSRSKHAARQAEPEVTLGAPAVAPAPI